MADEHLLALLAEGSANWNRWRTAEPDKGLDLSAAVLPDANLSGINFSDVNLSRAVLRNAQLEGANLSGADLSFANLQGAKLQGAAVDGASFLGAYLTGADVRGVDFTNTKITGATYDQSEVRAKAEQDHRRLSTEVTVYGVDTSGDVRPSRTLRAEPGRVLISGAGASLSVTAPPEDFVAIVDCALTPDQVQSALTALADYYRKCGGMGFRIRFRLEDAQVEAFARVR